MITAQEALSAVRTETKLDGSVIKETGILGNICKAIINNINRGWLCVSIDSYRSNSKEFSKAIEDLKELNYSFDKHYMCYWMSEQRWDSDDSL